MEIVTHTTQRKWWLPSGPDRRLAVGVIANSAPAGWLRGRVVIGHDGEHLGVVTLVVRRSDGVRLAVVHRRRPSPRVLVLDLTGCSVDNDGFLHVVSDVDVRHAARAVEA
jgi:hypothetical protein